MGNAYSLFSIKETLQSEPIPGKNMVPNSAGGYVWAIDDWQRLERFLVLGVESPTFYIKEPRLVRENAEAVERCIKADGKRVVATAVEVSVGNRAPKNESAIFVLALCISLGDLETRVAARQALPKVCRTGTHLFHFAQYTSQLRGWGSALNRAISDWYQEKPADALAYDAVKYQQRDGWGHADLLRKVRPTPVDAAHDHVYKYIVDGWQDSWEHGNDILSATECIKTILKPTEAARFIAEHRLPREVVPTVLLKEPVVWEALLQDMPPTALLRNLGNMTKVGLVKPLSEAEKFITTRLANGGWLRQARVHPVAVLVAMLTYGLGHGVRGHGEWQPTRAILDALDGAFYASFGSVEPTGKRIMLALDVSGSMSFTWHSVAGVPGLTPRVASAAMALITANVEKEWLCTGFSTELTPLSISPRQRLDDVCAVLHKMKMGGTDCAQPMLWAEKQGLAFDAFVVYTDNETWHGVIHPAQALQRYRQRFGIPAKLAVVGMVSDGFSIADPNDGGMMDFVGFDAAAPQVMSDFIAG